MPHSQVLSSSFAPDEKVGRFKEKVLEEVEWVMVGVRPALADEAGVEVEVKLELEVEVKAIALEIGVEVILSWLLFNRLGITGC